MTTAKLNLYYNTKEDGTSLDRIWIIDSNNDSIICAIDVYTSVEGEDERIKTICKNLGVDFSYGDMFAIKNVNVHDQFIDNNLINRKRKELLLGLLNETKYQTSLKSLVSILNLYEWGESSTIMQNVLPPFYIGELFTDKMSPRGAYIEGIRTTADMKQEIVDDRFLKYPTRFAKLPFISLGTNISDVDRDDPFDTNGNINVKTDTLHYTGDFTKLNFLKNVLEEKYLPVGVKIISNIANVVNFESSRVSFSSLNSITSKSFSPNRFKIEVSTKITTLYI